MDDRKLVGAALPDLSAAFDVISHELLLGNVTIVVVTDQDAACIEFPMFI